MEGNYSGNLTVGIRQIQETSYSTIDLV